MPIHDRADCVVCNASDCCNGARLRSIKKCPANSAHFFSSQFPNRGTFSAQINQSCSPLMTRVFFNRNPLKILRAVVRFVAVYVVDMISVLISRNKRHCDKAMVVKRAALSVALNNTSQISVVGKPYAALSRIESIRLRCAPSTFSRRLVCGRPYAATSRYLNMRKSRNAMPFNVFHEVIPLK